MLIDVGGVLYGTTMLGGGTGCEQQFGCGTVFSFDPASGAETLLHKFQDKSGDGVFPAAGLVEAGGVLYGTASEGGEYSCNGEPYGCGIVFSITPTTGFHVLHYFRERDADGGVPYAGVIAVKRKLYGTTQKGGTYTYGTVFEVAQ